MNEKNRIIAVIAAVIFTMAFFVSAQAQVKPTPPKTPPTQPQQPQSEPLQGTVNCFDYYKFGSVQVDIESSTATLIPGVPIIFKGKIKNANDYPIVDGAVYVKIFRKQNNDKETQANGHNLVDQFFVKENITLNAKEEENVVFNWKVPNYAISGEYQVATFFTSAKKFNLLGLSFTDDVVGNTFNFNVKTENTKTIEFNKNTVKLNDTEYHFAAFPPRFKKDEDVTVKTQLKNSTTKKETVPVTWTLYSWDGQRQENVIDTKTENIEINPNETKNLEYKITNQDYPVYYIVAEAKYKDAKSILGIRFVRNDANKVRLNFPAVTSFPLRANENQTLFTCLHNSGQADRIENNKLILTLLDESGKEIHKYNYEGPISGAMMGLKDEFTPTETIDSFTLKAELYTDNKLVDSAMMKYDCKDIDSTVCQPKIENNIVQSATEGGMSLKRIIIYIVLGLLALSIIAILVFVIKRRSAMNILILGLVITAGLLFGGVEKGEAKSVVWSQTYNLNLAYKGTVTGWTYVWFGGLQNPGISVNYSAKIKYADTEQEISDSSIIPVGSVIIFETIPYANSDISWYGTGYTTDSPYGHWNPGAGKPSNTCSAGDNIGIGYGGASIHVPLSVNPYGYTITNSGSAILQCISNRCTVNQPGTIRIDFNYTSTYGKFYYQYYYVSTGCQSSSNAMHQCDYFISEDYGDPNGNYLMCHSAYNSSYSFSIPAQTITYNLTAVSANNVPTVNITGPAEGVINIDHAFTATATDSDGDQIRYGFDWNNDNIVDQWIPGIGYVSSGTAQSAVHQWITNGSKTFQVLAQDQNGSNSAWASHTINITTPPNCPADCTAWSSYGTCSASCLGGTQTKTCTSLICQGFPLSQSCNTQACPPKKDLNWREVSPN